MKVIFNSEGLPYDFGDRVDNYVGENTIAEVSDDIEMWRVSYDYDTTSVVIRYEGMSNEDAHAQKIADEEAADAE